MAAERHAAVAIVGHDAGDDEGDARVDRPVLNSFRVIGVNGATQSIFDAEDGRLAMADAERREG